jgi:NAD(P)-dependent dehydrogenase (short-subunit alcohol dehydrogenase family)
MDPFRDKVAIVTGGASGMGRAVCRELGRRKARAVVVADIRGEEAEEVAFGISHAGGKARAVRLDVSVEEDVRRVVTGTYSEHGRLDYLFNNAGIGVGGETKDMLPGHWRRIVEVNLNSVIYGTTAAYPLMIRQGSGHIVNTASLGGLIATPGVAAYNMTKHAVVGLSLSLRLEAAAYGVNVSVVCPGMIDTDIFRTSVMVGGTSRDKFHAKVRSKFRPMDAEKAGLEILEGTARNRAVIVFPAQARILWALYRFRPAFLNPLFRGLMKELREASAGG